MRISNRIKKYYKTRLIIEKLLEEKIDYNIKIKMQEDKFSEEKCILCDVYIEIKPSNKKIGENLIIHIDETLETDLDNQTTIRYIDKARMWGFGLDSSEMYMVEDLVEYLKFIMKNRISVEGIEKESGIKGWFYFDIKDMNKLDEFIENLKEEYQIFNINTFYKEI